MIAERTRLCVVAGIVGATLSADSGTDSAPTSVQQRYDRERQTTCPGATVTKTIECSSAEDLLEALSPVSPHFRSAASRDLILFRGCADATWRLVPSALRDVRPRTLRQQVRMEIDVLTRFVSECDANGLPIPNDTEDLRAEMVHLTQPGRLPLRVEGGVLWPTDRWLALIALAQHNGLRTRLLDWTTSPFVAAYFAALPHTPDADNTHLAIWALTPFYADTRTAAPPHRIVFLHNRTTFRFTWLTDWRGFAVVDTTRAGNPNIIAQHGFLTAQVLGCGPEGMWDASWDEPSLDEMLEVRDPPSPSRLTRFTLHCRHAPRLLDLLKRYGVSTATMFPGYAGAARSINERPQPDPADFL